MSWAGGLLTAADHPDPERERALVALGGRPYRCLHLLDHWNRHADDLDVLVLASRGVADDVPVDATEPDEHGEHGHVGVQGVTYMGSYRGQTLFSRHGGHRHPHLHGANRAEAPPDRGQEALLTLDRRLADRWVATVIATWTQRIADGDPRVSAAGPALQAAIYGRARRTVRTWLGDPSRAVDLRMLDPDEQPSAVLGDTGHVQLALGFGWLGDVWLPGFATAFGRLCLGVERTADTAWNLLTVGPELGEPRVMRVSW